MRPTALATGGVTADVKPATGKLHSGQPGAEWPEGAGMPCDGFDHPAYRCRVVTRAEATNGRQLRAESGSPLGSLYLEGTQARG